MGGYSNCREGAMQIAGEQVQCTKGEQGISGFSCCCPEVCICSSLQLSNAQHGTTVNVTTISEKIIAKNFMLQKYKV